MRKQNLQVLMAAGLDALAGDPRDVLHPVRWTGRAITALEKLIYPLAPGYAGGVLLTGLTLGAVALALSTLPLNNREGRGPVSLLAGAVLVDATISFKQLTGRSREIRTSLERGDLSRARDLAGEMVGRDTWDLTCADVVRATVETLAENASDGIFAPCIYALLGGARAAFLYRTVNTLDSMVGYRNQRYARFGWASARLDDLANLLPSRVTAAFLLAAGTLCGADMLQSVKILRQDAQAHASPNAGWPEAIMAGALRVRLGGTNTYNGIPHDGAGLGDPLEPLEPRKIGEAVRMVTVAYALLLGITALTALLAGGRRR
jgi:adenosylcobinamide-phosphate synthase